MSDQVRQTPTLDKLSSNAGDDDDDLDDLDDVLDQFSAPPPPPPTAALATPSTGGANRPRTNTLTGAPPTSLPGDSSNKVPNPFVSISEEEEDELSKAFTEELVKGMESLMKEVTQGSGASGVSGGGGDRKEEKEMTEEERNKAFKAAWEAMLIEELGQVGGEEFKGATTAASGSSKAGPSASASGGGDFQDKIKQAMEKLRDSEEKLGGSSSSSDQQPESFEALLKSLTELDSLGDLGTEGGGEGESGNDEKQLAALLESMMGQLLSKEVLYDPLKELGDGFPGYLSNPPKPLSDEDRTRYEKQHACVKRILIVFEKADYSDTHVQYSKEIVDLMSEMQSYGSPPAEIMGDLPPELDGNTPEGCIVG